MDKRVKDYVNDMAKLINKLKPFIMIAFLVFAIMGITNFVKYVKLQPQIKENCGWEDERVKCFCEQKVYYEKKSYYETGNNQISIEYLGNDSSGDILNGT